MGCFLTLGRSIAEQAVEMSKLNMELMDTLVVTAQRLFDYVDRHGIVLDGLDSLHTLIANARRIMNQISEDRYHGNSS